MASINTASEVSDCMFINNGLLFFIFNKIDCMNQEDLLSLCMDFYSEEEASEAVLLAFEKYGCPE